LQLQSLGVRVRGIWALDAANQGASGVLNEAVIGDQPCWNDYPRDVLHFINTFAAQLPPPIVGMGHSYGGHAMSAPSPQSSLWAYLTISRVRTSLMHPSLFTAMVQIDPVIEDSSYPIGYLPAKASVRRLDIWPTHADAERYFRSRVFYKSWDPRCLDLQIVQPLLSIHPAELVLTTYARNTGSATSLQPHTPTKPA
jgi:hypothetical protein